MAMRSSGTKWKAGGGGGRGRMATDRDQGTKLLRSLLAYLQSPNRRPQRTFINSAKKNGPEAGEGPSVIERGELTMKLVHILGSLPGFRTPVGAFLGELERRYGIHCADVCGLARFYPRVLSVQLESESGELFVSLAGGKRHALQGQQVLFLFLLKPDLELTPDQFIRKFRSIFTFTPDPDALRDAFPEIIKWRQRLDGSMVLELVAVQRFALEARQVLLSFSYDNVSLNCFANAYQSRFTEMDPGAYGYSSVIGLIRAASHVLYMKGRGLNSTICINRNFLGTLRLVRPDLFLKKTGEERSELKRKKEVPPRLQKLAASRRKGRPVVQTSTKTKPSTFVSLATPATRAQAVQRKCPKEQKVTTPELNRTFDVQEEPWTKLVEEEEGNWETDTSSGSDSDDEEKSDVVSLEGEFGRLLPPSHFSVSGDSGFGSVTPSERSEDDTGSLDVMCGRQMVGFGRGTQRRCRLAIRFPVPDPMAL